MDQEAKMRAAIRKLGAAGRTGAAASKEDKHVPTESSDPKDESKYTEEQPG